MKTDAERKRAERERKRRAGLVKVEVWVPAAAVAKVRRYAARLSLTVPAQRKGG